MNEPNLSKQITKKVRAVEQKIIDIRHQIHQNPELSFAEKETAALAAEEMRKLGFEVRENSTETAAR